MKDANSVCELGISDVKNRVGKGDILLSPFSRLGIDIPDGRYVYDGFMIVLYTSGSFRMSINGRAYINEGMALLIHIPGQVVEISGKSDDFSRVSIHIPSSFLHEIADSGITCLFEDIRKHPLIEINEKQKDLIYGYYRFLSFRENCGIDESGSILHILRALLAEISWIYDKSTDVPSYPSDPHKEEILRRFFSLLMEKYMIEHSASYYADCLSISLKYLSRIVKMNTGRSVKAWINEVLSDRAKFLLLSTDAAVYQIAEDLAFADSSSFVQFFRTETGVSPLQYRKMHSQRIHIQ